MWRNDGRFLDAAMCRCVRRESIYYVIVRETVRDTGGDLISSFFLNSLFELLDEDSVHHFRVMI